MAAARHSNQFPLSSLGDGGDDREGGGRAGKRAGPRRLHQGEREAFEFPLKRGRREGEGTHDFLSKENWGGAGGGERGRRRRGGGGGGGENLCAERADKGNHASEEGGGRPRPSVCPPAVRLLVVYLVGLLRAACRPLKSTRTVALCSSQVDCRGEAPGRPNEARVGRESGREWRVVWLPRRKRRR